MGCVLGLLGSAACSGLACCFTGAAVSCCCRGCCSCKNSTSTRIVYAFLLFLTVLTAGIFLIPDLQPQLEKIDSLCDKEERYNETTKQWETGCLYSVSAIYRLFFALTMFFGAMSIIMIDVDSSHDCRAALQNGLWFFKLAAIIGLAVGGFYLPHSFPAPWMLICIAASTVYIVIQLILTIDFAFFLNEYLGDRHEETQGKCYLCVQFFTMIICYGLALAMIVLLFIFYTTPNKCETNKAILGVNIIACMVFSCLSILRKVQDRVKQSGLLQSSIITLYVMFITWTAFSNQPDKDCNPGIKNILVHGNERHNYEVNEDPNVYLKPENILALIFSSICVLYSALRNSSQSSKIFGSNNNADETNATNAEEGGDKKRERGKVHDDETEETTYSYSFFHFIMCLASMYTTMCLTNWIDPNSRLNSESFYGNSTAFWFKVVSSWICALLYTWTLLAPFVFPERDFS